MIDPTDFRVKFKLENLKELLQIIYTQ